MPLLSILVTTRRPELRSWLMWNLARQDFVDYELVLHEHTDGTYLDALNRTLSFARGDFVHWIGDDDWQHPAKLTWLAEAAQAYDGPCGWGHGIFYNVHTGEVSTYENPAPICVNAIIPRELAQSVTFKTQSHAGSTDTQWFAEVSRHATPKLILPRMPHSVWMAHGDNTARRSYQWRAPDAGELPWSDVDFARVHDAFITAR